MYVIKRAAILNLFSVWPDKVSRAVAIVAPFLIGSVLYLLRPCHNIPSFILYNLSDGLWAFSFALCICTIWKHNKALRLWLSIFLLSAILMELGQLTIIPGTCDPLDILMYCCGSAAAYIYHRKSTNS